MEEGVWASKAVPMGSLTAKELYDQHTAAVLMNESEFGSDNLLMKIKLQKVLACRHVMGFLLSDKGARLRQWWSGQPDVQYPWLNERNDREHYMYYMLATVLMRNSADLKYMFCRVNRSGVFDMVTRGRGYCTVSWRMPNGCMMNHRAENHMHAALLYMYYMPRARTFKLFEAARCADTFRQALCMMAISASYGIPYIPEPTMDPIISKTIEGCRYPDLSVCLRNYPRTRLLAVDDPVVKNLVRYPGITVYTRVVPASDPMTFNLQIGLYGPGRQSFSIAHQFRQSGEVCNLLHLQPLFDGPPARLALASTAEMMGLIPPCTLTHEPSTDTSLPLVRGAAGTEPFHYPVRLPSVLKPSIVLTKGQVLTQEFMDRVEDTPFVSRFARALQRGQTTYYLSPLLSRAPTVVNPRAVATVSKYTGGIVADETGCGKTLTALVRCLRDKRQSSMVVVPDTLVLHWSTEARKHGREGVMRVWEDPCYRQVGEGENSTKGTEIKPQASSFHVVVIHKTRDIQCLQWDSKPPRGVRAMPRMIVVGHSPLRSKTFKEMVTRNFTFDRLVVDEAHAVTASCSDTIDFTIKRHTTWMITATPNNKHVQNGGMLQLDRTLNALNGAVPVIPSALKLAMYKYLTVKNELDRTRLRVVTVKHTCPVGQHEESFLASVRELLVRYVGSKHAAQNLYRFFTLLERVCAGGHLHRDLVLKVLERWLFNHHHLSSSSSNCPDGPRTVATKTAFSGPKDECPLCLCPFANPVQAPCGHVYCEMCVRALIDIGRGTCPMRCGGSVQPYQVPRWPPGPSPSGAPPPPEPSTGVGTKRRHPGSASVEWARCARRRADDAGGFVSRSDNVKLHEGLTASAAASPEWREGEIIDMQGKHRAVSLQLDTWVAERQQGAHIVMFMKAQLPAQRYFETIRSNGLSVLCAGLMGVGKRDSMANVEKFKQGESDVLLISNRYCSGLDLFIASEVWLLNADLSAPKMEQSHGRITRVAQAHHTVTVRVFVYPRMLDEFLWEFRQTLRGRTRYGKSQLYLMHYWLSLNDPESIACRWHVVLRTIAGEHYMTSLPVTCRKRNGHDTYMSFGDKLRITYGGGPETNQLFLGGRNVTNLRLLESDRNLVQDMKSLYERV